MLGRQRSARPRGSAPAGDKVHLTDTCDDDTPHLITHVETTQAPLADSDVTSAIHQALQAQDRLPTTHFVDTGYVDADLLVTSQRLRRRPAGSHPA